MGCGASSAVPAQPGAPSEALAPLATKPLAETAAAATAASSSDAVASMAATGSNSNSSSSLPSHGEVAPMSRPNSTVVADFVPKSAVAAAAEPHEPVPGTTAPTEHTPPASQAVPNAEPTSPLPTVPPSPEITCGFVQQTAFAMPLLPLPSPPAESATSAAMSLPSPAAETATSAAVPLPSPAAESATPEALPLPSPAAETAKPVAVPLPSPVAETATPVTLPLPNPTAESTKPALKHRVATAPDSPGASKTLRFQFHDHELRASPHSGTVEVTALPEPLGVAECPSEGFAEADGMYGAVEYSFLDDPTIYRILPTRAALRATDRFAVFTHIALENLSEDDDIDATIVLDNAPPALVRKASMQRVASFLVAPKPGGVRFESEVGDARVATPPNRLRLSPVASAEFSGALSPQSPSLPSPLLSRPPRPPMARTRSERPQHVRQELVHMDSGSHSCSVCLKIAARGLFCMADDHFLCEECFSPHVQQLCRDMQRLQGGQFSVYCPVPGCLAPSWNAYHVRKCLSGKVLEQYIDTLVQACQVGVGVAGADAGAPSAPLGSPSAPLGSPSAQLASPARELQRSNTLGAPDKRKELQLEILQLKETLGVLKTQLLHHGIRPIEYIPLTELNAELTEIFAQANAGGTFDEARLDYLLMCMDNNPEYVAQQEAKAQAWRDDIAPFAAACLAAMRGYVPPHIFHSSLTSLVETDGLHLDLAKRFLSRKCLWLVRLHPDSIDKIHEVELTGRFNFEAQGLDLVELASIYAALPDKFTCDPNGKKTQWRALLEQNLKKLDGDARSRALAAARHPKHRFAAYTREEPRFLGLDGLHEFKHV